MRLIPVPVDAAGLDFDAGMRTLPRRPHGGGDARATVAIGDVMPLTRRLALLRWARQSNAWVFENDDDNQSLYIGQSVAALQGLDKDGRVIYYGDFINVLCAVLSICFLAVPPDLVDASVAAQFASGAYAFFLVQAVLADFMVEGHFTHHLRRVRRLYAARGAALLSELKSTLDGLLDVHPGEARPYVIGWLPGGLGDRDVARKATRRRPARPTGIAHLPIAA